MATIIHKTEKQRGCGYRKPGGMYFVSDGPGKECGRLPIALTVCPCCNAGIKPHRGFQWVLGSLFMGTPCPTEKQLAANNPCYTCPLYLLKPTDKVGLMWVGEKFYPTPADFMREGAAMGVSKRIPQIPKDFKVGESWIMLAHRKAIGPLTLDTLADDPEGGKERQYQAGVFQAFKPARIEYVVKGTETEEELDRLEKRGLTLVKVTPDTTGEQQDLNFETDDDGIPETPVIALDPD